MLAFTFCLILIGAPLAAAGPNLGIVNGDVVKSPDEFPFMAVTYNGSVKTGQFCGGVLIDKQWVLTAAHCLYDKKAQEMNVRAQVHRSDYDKDIELEKGVDRGLASYIVHPKYSQNSWEYDVALLKLESPVQVTPVALDDGSQDWSGKDAVVLGWGSQDVACTSYDSKLRRGNVTITSVSQCSTTAGGTGYFDKDLNICAGKAASEGNFPPAKSWVETGCGDSGGPLLVKSNGHYVVVGVVSWGSGNTWDVYMRTYGNLAWIKQTIGESTMMV